MKKILIEIELEHPKFCNGCPLLKLNTNLCAKYPSYDIETNENKVIKNYYGRIRLDICIEQNGK